METKRFIPCKALQNGDTTFTPFWELEYVPDDNFYGEGFKVKDDYKTYYNELTDCIYDLKKKKLILGISVEFKSQDNHAFNIGETVIVEARHSEYYEDVITDIIFENYLLSEFECLYYPHIKNIIMTLKSNNSIFLSKQLLCRLLCVCLYSCDNRS